MRLSADDDFEGWRAAARALASHDIAPEDIAWRVEGDSGDLFNGAATPPPPSIDGGAFPVPRGFVALAGMAARHSDPARFALLYTLLLRIRHQPASFTDQADPLVRRIEDLAKSVRRDIHKMHAFVRFREIQAQDGAPWFVAWFEPDHHIVRVSANFFIDRFASMRWSILTPALCLHWDGVTLREGPGAIRADAPSGDPVEETWKRYYAATFNPARLKVKAMLKEMPRKYWANMPETALIGQLIAGAHGREMAMVEQFRDRMDEEAAAAALPQRTWVQLRDEASACTRCALHRCATQTIFGEGPTQARLMFVGEQPGDQEDLAGRAFVGPAGQIFDRALGEAGIDRSRAYVTNAVKHFKFEQRGKRRLHARPNGGEVQACRWWLDQERALIRPSLTIA
ncbi:MAG: UdgX family uracil-DNA binding protein, partial [bacterium]|nr:UdgX family uracil-DNA binding protein [bacterium]